jgi:hypothetical protein
MHQRCSKSNELDGRPQSLHLTPQEKGLHFFKLLKKAGKFEWTKEAEDAFERLRKY